MPIQAQRFHYIYCANQRDLSEMDATKTVLDGQQFVLNWGTQSVEARIIDPHPRRFADPQDDSIFLPRTWHRGARLGSSASIASSAVSGARAEFSSQIRTAIAEARTTVQPTVFACARQCTPEIVRQCVRASEWMFLLGPDDDPTKQTALAGRGTG